jgi:hypothetical protein
MDISKMTDAMIPVTLAAAFKRIAGKQELDRIHLTVFASRSSELGALSDMESVDSMPGSIST